jgi:hypothetical protein
MNHLVSDAWRVWKELTRFYRVQEIHTGSNCYYIEAMTSILVFYSPCIKPGCFKCNMEHYIHDMVLWYQSFRRINQKQSSGMFCGHCERGTQSRICERLTSILLLDYQIELTSVANLWVVPLLIFIAGSVQP